MGTYINLVKGYTQGVRINTDASHESLWAEVISGADQEPFYWVSVEKLLRWAEGTGEPETASAMKAMIAEKGCDDDDWVMLAFDY